MQHSVQKKALDGDDDDLRSDDDDDDDDDNSNEEGFVPDILLTYTPGNSI